MSSGEEPKVIRKNDDAPIIKEWVSDDEKEDVSQPKTEKKIVRPSIVKKEFVKSKQQEKITRKTVKQVEQHRQNTHSPKRQSKKLEQYDGRLRCKGVTKQIIGVVPKGLVLRVVLVDLQSKDESKKRYKQKIGIGGIIGLAAAGPAVLQRCWPRQSSA
ncbi:hypothetical protein Tco_0570717 [Tanacetum coccineum]